MASRRFEDFYGRTETVRGVRYGEAATFPSVMPSIKNAEFQWLGVESGTRGALRKADAVSEVRFRRSGFCGRLRLLQGMTFEETNPASVRR